MRVILFTFLALCFSLPCFALQINSQVVLDRTYSKNYDVQSLELNRKISQQDIRQAKSQYDTLTYGDFSYTKDQSERNTSVFGTTTTDTRYTVGVNQLAPSGTEVGVSFSAIKQTSDSPFASSPSLFDTRTQIDLKQPIAKNYFGYQTRKNVTLAKELDKKTQHQTDNQVMDVAYQNLVTYWNWYLNKRLVSTNQSALSAAMRLLRTNRQKMVIGLIEESDIYAFAANVDLKRSDLYLTEYNLSGVESSLRVAINAPSESLTLGKESLGAKKYPSVTVMIDESLLTHPEYIAAKKTLDAQNIIVALNKNSRLPQVDLIGSLTLNGIDPAFSEALSDIGDGNTIFMGGVSVSFPIQNRYAKANYSKSQIQKTQLLYELKKTELKIMAEIREVYEKYLKSLSRMNVVATAVEHQRLKWEGEIKKYDQGRSDPDIVIRYQNDYIDTQKLYISSQVVFQLAKLELDYVRGKLK